MFQQFFGTWSRNAPWNVTTGDFNGDGRMDVIGSHEGNGAWWALLGQDEQLSTTRYFGRSTGFASAQLLSGTILSTPPM